MYPDGFHVPECEDQPDGFPCNCDHVKEQKQEEADNAAVDEALEREMKEEEDKRYTLEIAGNQGQMLERSGKDNKDTDQVYF